MWLHDIPDVYMVIRVSEDIDARKIGAHIKEIREGMGLSQRDLAERARCSKSAVGGIEAGLSLPSLALAARLADALDTTLDDIARGDR